MENEFDYDENFFGVVVPYHYLDYLPLEEALILYFIENALMTTAELTNETTIEREELEYLLVEFFPFLKEGSEVVASLVEKDYLCILESTDEVTLGSGMLHL